MATFPVGVRAGGGAAVTFYPASRGPMRQYASGIFASQRLSDDSIGQTTLTLTNVADGSRYRIEVASTGALASGTSATGTVSGASVAITLDYYPTGNALNTVKIKVRSASGGTKYKPYETQATLSKTAQSVFIAQVED